nr:hypothetical protein [Streptococcus lutetiensis]
MNKVKFFYSDYGYELEEKINEFAKQHEIIQVTLDQANYAHTAGSVKSLVLYRE